MKTGSLTHNILIICLSAILFIPFLGNVNLFDWDEINFAECAREMLVTGDYSSVNLNYQPFWEKPPLFIWLQAASMKVFGVNEFAARFPNALCGIITLVLLYNIGSKIYDRRFGILWTLCYAGSFLPHFYFKSGIIDPWFNLFIFLGIYNIILFSNQNDNSYRRLKGSNIYLIFSAIFIGIAILTKGPVALLIFGLCYLLYMIIQRRFSLTIKQIGIWVLALVLTGSSWFMIELFKGRSDIIVDFFQYQVRLLQTEDAGHGGPFFYHFLVLLIGCFPASVFALAAFRSRPGDSPTHRHFKLWIKILFWVVLILFSIVKTKIVHYSSLCYFPLTYLAAYYIYKVITGERSVPRYIPVLLTIIGVTVAIAITAVPFIESFKYQIISSGIIQDSFANENLKADVDWSGFEWFVGFSFLVALIISIRFILKKYEQGFYILFISSMVMINLAMTLIVPGVEAISQRAAIDFFKDINTKDAYVETLGYKSYAYLFYSEKQPEDNTSPSFVAWLNEKGETPGKVDPKQFKEHYINWLLYGEIDKPAYFISKNTEEENILKSLPQLEKTGEKNGYIFYRRK